MNISYFVARAIETKQWIIRADNKGVSWDGFKWNAIGEWTEAFDWNSKSECGGGLHGQDHAHGGIILGERLVFCITEGEHIAIGNKQVKVKKAMILLVNELPDGLCVSGNLSLLNTNISKLPENLSVGGYLDLYGTKIDKMPGKYKVNGMIYKKF